MKIFCICKILVLKRIVHNFTVGCFTFARILLPLQSFNYFLGHHRHRMEWFWPTIEINGFSMVLGSDNHWKRWFSMVFHHWSNDGMVTYHRWSLTWFNKLSDFICVIQNFEAFLKIFAQILLPLQTVNDLLRHHHHWMEWFRPTIEINGFSMVLGSGNHWKRWFSMVFHHWSNDGMVTYHRWSLVSRKPNLLECTKKEIDSL